MLNPKTNRLNYLEQLVPPSGFSLDFAVGATYSVDCNALLSACVALGSTSDSNSTNKELCHTNNANPVKKQTILCDVIPKIALFCDSRQYAVSSGTEAMLTEDIIFPITLDKKDNRNPSFHPKVWVIRYQKGTEFQYRVIVLSRNLTYNNNWDVIFTLNGIRGEKTKNNAPLIRFLNNCLEQSRKVKIANQKIAKQEKISNIIEELPNVDFHQDLQNSFFTDLEWISVDSKCPYQFPQSFQTLFIMSPFLSKSQLGRFPNPLDKETVLITRDAALKELDAEDFTRFKVYTMKSLQQDIHAKIYLLQDDTHTYLYLGSLNATHSAVCGGNVEFMVRLTADSKDIDLQTITNALFQSQEGTDKNPFKYINKKPDNNDSSDDDGKNALMAVFSEIVRLDRSATIESSNHEGKYNVAVKFENFENFKMSAGFSVDILPISGKQKAYSLEKEITWENLDLTELSETFVIKVSNKKDTFACAIQIPIFNLREELFPKRNEALLSSLCSKKDFFRYFLSILTLEKKDPTQDDFIDDLIGCGQSRGSASKGFGVPAYYEAMLKATVDNPKVFKNFRNLREHCTELPEDFCEMYNLFMEVATRFEH